MALVKQILEKLSQAKKYSNSSNIYSRSSSSPKRCAERNSVKYGKMDRRKCHITSERTGDVIGQHELKFETASEKITIAHEALDRKLFADGAIWSAEFLFENKIIGLNNFNEIVEKEFNF